MTERSAPAARAPRAVRATVGEDVRRRHAPVHAGSVRAARAASPAATSSGRAAGRVSDRRVMRSGRARSLGRVELVLVERHRHLQQARPSHAVDHRRDGQRRAPGRGAAKLQLPRRAAQRPPWRANRCRRCPATSTRSLTDQLRHLQWLRHARYSRVRISGPFAGHRDGVLDVGGQRTVGGDAPSSRRRARRTSSAPPAITIGSTASTTPGSSTGPRPRRPRFSTSGCSCIARPMPWPLYSHGLPSPADGDDGVDRRTDVFEVPARLHRGDAGGERGLGHLDQPLRLAASICADAHGERRVAVPPVDDRPAVDRTARRRPRGSPARGCRGSARRSPRRR